jgi:hypothetical protein
LCLSATDLGNRGKDGKELFFGLNFHYYQHRALKELFPETSGGRLFQNAKMPFPEAEARFPRSRSSFSQKPALLFPKGGEAFSPSPAAMAF